MCCCCPNTCNCGKCTLDHEQPNKFDRSQWCPPDRVSTWYMIYRVLVAAAFMGGIAGHIANSKQGAKWFIYMTDLGICFLAIHFFIDACLVTARWTWEKFRAGEYDQYHETNALTYAYKVSWAMHSCFFTIALWISLVYWAALHKFVVEAHLLKNELAVILNIFLHAINTLTCLIDIFVNGKPWRPLHFIWAVCFGLSYALFSVIYWAAGGTGICHDQATETAPYPNDNGEYCDPFIYPILDWENNAGMAFGVIAGGCLVIPVLHFLWMGLAWLREKVFSCCRGTNDDYVDSDGNARRFASTTV